MSRREKREKKKDLKGYHNTVESFSNVHLEQSRWWGDGGEGDGEGSSLCSAQHKFGFFNDGVYKSCLPRYRPTVPLTVSENSGICVSENSVIAVSENSVIGVRK